MLGLKFINEDPNVRICFGTLGTGIYEFDNPDFFWHIILDESAIFKVLNVNLR